MVSHNAKFTQFFSKFSCLILASFLFFSTVSCKNFFNGTDFLSQLEESVSYENAQQSTFTVKADSGTGSFLSDGDKTAKVGFDFSLQFTLNTEDYVLNHWGVFNPDDMSEIPDILETTTISTEEELARGVYKVNIKFLRQVSNVILKPVCYVIPKAIYINTRDESRADGFTQDTDIIIKFNKPIPEDWFIDCNNTDPEWGKNAKNIEITCKGYDLLKQDQPAESIQYQGEVNVGFFLKPKLSNDRKTLTIATNKFMHMLSNPGAGITAFGKTSFADDGYIEIEVILHTTNNSVTATDAVEGEKIPFQGDIEWSYKISNKLDGIPPSIKNSNFYKVGNPENFTDFKGEYPKERLSMAHCDSPYVTDKFSYVKERYFVSKKYNYNSSEKEFCMFFSFTVQDEGGISAVQSTYQKSENTGSMNPDWLNKVDIPSDHLKITKIGDSTYEVKGWIEPEYLFDIRKDVEYYNIGLIFKDYSGNASTVTYVTVIASLNTIEKDDIKVWNEFPDVEKEYENIRVEDVDHKELSDFIKKTVNKIYVSVPKRVLWSGNESKVYNNYTPKVYYGHSKENVSEHSSTATCKNLIKDEEKSTTEKDVYYFTFDSLDAEQNDYFSVDLLDEYIPGNVIEEITNTFQVPSKHIVFLEGKGDNSSSYWVGDKKYELYTNVKLTFPVHGSYYSSFAIWGTISSEYQRKEISAESPDINAWHPLSFIIYEIANSKYSENGKKLYGMPYILGYKNLGTSVSKCPEDYLFSYGISFDYNGTSESYAFDELTVNLGSVLENNYYKMVGFDNNGCVLTLQIGDNPPETYTEFPFILKNIGACTYDESGEPVTITASLSHGETNSLTTDVPITVMDFKGVKTENLNYNEVIELTEKNKIKLSELKIIQKNIVGDVVKTIDLIDVTPPTLNKDGKTLTAFPELLYLNKNYDYGSGFTIIGAENDPNATSGDANIPLCLTPWKEKWSKLTNYAGTFGNDPGTEGISVSNTITKGDKKIDKLNILIRNNMGTGKYIITTANGGVQDTWGNKQNAALDYLYHQNYYLLKDLSRDDMKSVNYSCSNGSLSVNYGDFKTNTKVIQKINSQAIPLIKNGFSYYWDYNEITESGKVLPTTFKDTFVKCGTKYEIIDDGEYIPVYSLPKYSYFDGTNLGITVGMTNVHQIDDKTVVINSDQKYLVQTYFSNENMSEDIDWELFATVENPKILNGLDFYAVEINGIPSQDTYYRVIIHWADGTSEYCPVHMIKGMGAPQ